MGKIGLGLFGNLKIRFTGLIIAVSGGICQTCNDFHGFCIGQITGEKSLVLTEFVVCLKTIQE
jgi:hypothetical protein